MSNFLKEIIEYKKKLIEEKRPLFASIKEKLANTEYNQYHLFHRVLCKGDSIKLIAEIKKASPSKGLLREDFDVLKIAQIYVENKAAALSILTEDKYFLGKPEYVKKVSEKVNVPVLVKDFILDEDQIYEARFNGASAILLIAAILPDDQLRNFIEVAARLDLDCLVEIHDKKELNRAINAGADIIGVNNRDLHTFEVDLKISEKLIPKIPKDKLIVAESGIRTHQDVLWLKDLGADAVLIGETFMVEADIDKKVKEVMYGES